jgi:hypothetical protein
VGGRVVEKTIKKELDTLKAVRYNHRSLAENGRAKQERKKRSAAKSG